MLLSMLLPHVANLIRFTMEIHDRQNQVDKHWSNEFKRFPKDYEHVSAASRELTASWCSAFRQALTKTLMCGIGLHELITTDDAFENRLYSIARQNNALFEDHPQFWL